MAMPNPTTNKPTNIDSIISIIQKEFPSASIRITGQARTIKRQAELMAQRIRTNRNEFLSIYRSTPHIIEMDHWYLKNKNATLTATSLAFETIINNARSRGALVSNHLSDTARDIRWPIVTNSQLDQIEVRLNSLGAKVIREPNAAGGRHWHVDW